jgi:hypothetical protein
MDPRTRSAFRSMTKANGGVFLAMGALLAAAVNLNRAIKKLEELIQSEILEEAAEEEPDAKMARIVEEYSERVN